MTEVVINPHDSKPNAPAPAAAEVKRPKFGELMHILVDQSPMSPSRKEGSKYALDTLVANAARGIRDLSNERVSTFKHGAVYARVEGQFGAQPSLREVPYDTLKKLGDEEEINKAEMLEKGRAMAAFGMLPTGWTPENFADQLAALPVENAASIPDFNKIADECAKQGKIAKIYSKEWGAMVVGGNPNFGMRVEFPIAFDGKRKGYAIPKEAGMAVFMGKDKMDELVRNASGFPPDAPHASLQNYGETGLPIDYMKNRAVFENASRF